MAAGAAWMVAFKLLDRSIGIVSVIVLARLLVPSDFGLVAMATAIIAVVQLISSFNFDIALIQSRQAVRAQYDTAWTLNVAMASVCALLVAAAARPAGIFYGDERLGGVLLLLSLAVWIQGFENIGVVAFRKELKFNREFQLLLTRRVSVFLTTVSIALATRSYWALVLGIFAGSVCGVLVSYLFHPFRPRFDLTARTELLQFSRWLVFSNVMNTLSSRAADLIIGKSLGPAPLGLFGLAHEISHLPSTELAAPVNRAVYPGYAKVASDPSKLNEKFLEVLGFTALLSMPLALGIATVAPLLIPLLLGDAWRAAVPLTRVLSLAGLLASLRTNVGYVFLALGKSELQAALTAIRLAIAAPALVLGTRYFGITGAAWAMLGASIAMLLITQVFIYRVLRLSVLRQGVVLWRPALASLGMVLLVSGYLDPLEHGAAAGDVMLELVSVVGLGIVAYVSLMAVLWAASGCPRSAEVHVMAMSRGLFGRLRRNRADRAR